MRRVHTVVSYLDVTKPVCNHLLGSSHTPTHRLTVGVALMVVGVTVAKISAGSEFMVFHFVGDGLGYAIHGLGLTPFVEVLLSRVKPK